jgi:hypothetical protein
VPTGLMSITCLGHWGPFVVGCVCSRHMRRQLRVAECLPWPESDLCDQSQTGRVDPTRERGTIKEKERIILYLLVLPPVFCLAWWQVDET